MDKKLVSIVVPIYNAEVKIKRCIKSILQQSYKNLEIILVNDGSTDRTALICQEFVEQDKRVLLINKENTGVSDTRNTGIIRATGDYITFIDADDYIENDMIECMINEMEDDRLVFCGYYDEYWDRVCNSRREYIFEGKEEIVYIPESEILKIYKKTILNPPWGKIFNRRKLIEHKICFYEKWQFGEDLDFVLKYISATAPKFVVINKPFYHYTHDGGESLTNCHIEKLLEIRQKHYYHLKKICRENGAGESDLEDLDYIFLKAYIYAIVHEFRWNKRVTKMVSYFQARKNMRDEEVLYLLKKKNIYQHHKFIYYLAKNQAVLTLSLAIIYKELAYKKNNKNGKKNNKKF